LYFDKESGLLVRTSSKLDDGRTITMTFGDYREIDGVKVPFRIQGDDGQGFSYTLTARSVKHDVDLADDLFKKPAN
jgi:outer membrane lipoprotein-sorting protein